MERFQLPTRFAPSRSPPLLPVHPGDESYHRNALPTRPKNVNITGETPPNFTRLRAEEPFTPFYPRFAVKVDGDRKVLVLAVAQGFRMANVIKSESLSPVPRLSSANSPEAEDGDLNPTKRSSSVASGKGLSTSPAAQILTPNSSGDGISTSNKRPTPEDDGDELLRPPAKRQRTDDSIILTAEPQDWDQRITAVVDTAPSYDHGIQQLLRRSIAMVLQTMGFASASREAFEAIHAQVDEYMMSFLRSVTQSMHSNRRAQTTPLDFEHALRQFGLTSFQLKPHLKPPISKERTQVHLELEDPEALPAQPNAALLGPELSGVAEMKARKYIPKNFPPLPPLHTWKSTEVKTPRETDPRKIREKAAAEARLAEEALGRLMKPVLRKEYKEVTARRALVPELKRQDDKWVEMIKNVFKDKLDDPNVPQEWKEEIFQPILINPERSKYGAKLMPLKKKTEKE